MRLETSSPKLAQREAVPRPKPQAIKFAFRLNEGVDEALRSLIFETFERTGSAMQTAKLFHNQGLRFPRRLHNGLNKGELHWVRAAYSRILQVLHNPRNYDRALLAVRQTPSSHATIDEGALSRDSYSLRASAPAKMSVCEGGVAAVPRRA